MRSRGLCSTPKELSRPRPGGGRWPRAMLRAKLAEETGGGLSVCAIDMGGPKGLACRGLWLWLLDAGLLLLVGGEGDGLTATAGEPEDAWLL